MNKILKLPVFILLCLSFSMNLQAGNSDFDAVCEYFGKLDKLPNVNAMSNTDRNAFIIDSIESNLPKSSNARAAWTAIDSAVAEKHYELFCSAAESVLNKPWKCEAMQKWAAKTGEFNTD